MRSVPAAHQAKLPCLPEQGPWVERAQLCFLHICNCDLSCLRPQLQRGSFLAILGAACNCWATAGWVPGPGPGWPTPHSHQGAGIQLARDPVPITKPPLTLDPDPERATPQHLLPPLGPGWGHLPAGLEARGEGGNLVELVEDSRGRRRRKKLLSSPHLSDSTRVVFPEPEWPNSFSLILGCRFCVGRSCWMKRLRCVS